MKNKILVTMFFMLLIIPGVHAAANLTQYFTVNDFKLCNNANCDIEYVEYSEINGDNKQCMEGDFDIQFLTLLDWSFNYDEYGSKINSGDYIEIPFLNNVQSPTQASYLGASLDSTNFIVKNSAGNEITIGTWSISNTSATTTGNRKLKIIFNENINDSTLSKNLIGQIQTSKNIYMSRTYNEELSESSNVLATIGNKTKKICNTAYDLPEIDNNARVSFSSKSNRRVTWLAKSSAKTIKELYKIYSERENSSSVDSIQLSPDAIFENVKLEYELDPNVTLTGFLFDALLLYPTSLSSLTASPRATSINLTSAYFVEDDEPEKEYETLNDYKENIGVFHYGIYEDSEGLRTLIVNFGSQPSKDLKYSDAIRKTSPSCDSYGCQPGSYLKNRFPYTFNNNLGEIMNSVYGDSNEEYLGNVYGGKIAAWDSYLSINYGLPVYEDTIVNIALKWTWNDVTGEEHQSIVQSRTTLRAPSTYAISKGVVRLVLRDEDTKDEITGSTIELVKCSDNSCSNSTSIGTKITDTNGIVSFSNLDNGFYKFIQDSEIENNYKEGYEKQLKVYTTDNYQEGTFSGLLNDSIFEVNVTGLMLYGTNKRKEYTIKYLPGAKGSFDPVEYKILYGDPFKTFTPSTGNDWIFGGWIDEDGQPYDDTSVGIGVTKNKTYIAQWYKNVKVTTKHYDNDANENISGVDDIENIDRNNTPYSTTEINDNPILKNYDYVDYSITPTSKTPSGDDRGEEDITVIYNYRIKNANINVNYVYCKDANCTNKETLHNVTVEQPYLTKYTAELLDSNSYPEYEPLDVSEKIAYVNSDTVDNGEINIELRYRKKDSNAIVNLSTTSNTEKISELGQGIDYKIEHTTTYKSYRGASKVTLTHKLPYSIDINKSQLDGGIYDETTNTIKWEVEKNVDSFVNSDETLTDTITKNIILYYIGEYAKEDVMKTDVTSTLEIDDKEPILTIDSVGIPIEIKGKITVKYITQDGEEVFETIENEEKVGLSYKPIERAKEGYKLVSKLNKTYEYTTEDQVLEYIYERIKVNINISSNEGGETEGSEEIYYGENSTEGKIKIKAKEGYIIDKVKLNGEEIEIPKEKTELVLSQFINVKDDKKIEVEFKKVEVVNVPPTGIKIISTIIMSLLLVSIGLAFVLKFRKRNSI